MNIVELGPLPFYNEDDEATAPALIAAIEKEEGRSAAFYHLSIIGEGKRRAVGHRGDSVVDHGLMLEDELRDDIGCTCDVILQVDDSGG